MNNSFGIRAKYIATISGEQNVQEDMLIRISRGYIDSVEKFAPSVYEEGLELVEYPDHLILPGFVNSHTHVAGTVFRGVTEDHLNGFYGKALPMENRLCGDDVLKLSRLGIAEALLSGCTTINDMYLFADETARAASELGIRAQIAYKTFESTLGKIQFDDWSFSREQGREKFARALALHEEWQDKGDGRVTTRLSVHAPDTSSPELIGEIAEAARARGIGLHIHAAQSMREVSHMRETYGCGSIEFLDRCGALFESTTLAHCVHTSDTELDLVKERNAVILHCPYITAKRGMFAPSWKWYERGIRVGWGTDWVSMDPWKALRFGILLPRVLTGRVDVVDAMSGLRYFTASAADALGLGNSVGMIAPGYAADLISVRLTAPHLIPHEDLLPTVVYNAESCDVEDVFVAGERVVTSGRLVTGNMDDIASEARDVVDRIYRNDNGRNHA